MTRTLRAVWLDPDWRDEGMRWASEQLARVGVAVTGVGEQIRLERWSAVLRLPTDNGAFYFKAVAPVHAFEPSLTARLARLRPEAVTEVVATDEERAWLLTRDAGTRLRELVHGPADLGLWEEALPRYAELQLAGSGECKELLELGVPDQRSSTLPGLFAAILNDGDALRAGDEALTDERVAELRRKAASYAAACERLAAYAIPETIQHDDLHDGNVFVNGGRYVFFDWGDACVSHPFTSLVVILRALAWKLELEPGGPWVERLLDAYLEPWRSFASRDELVEAAELAYRVGTVGRAVAYHRMVGGEYETRESEAESIPYGLRLWLERGPMGTWR
jgi:Phosphotransferase enzyme family